MSIIRSYAFVYVFVFIGYSTNFCFISKLVQSIPTNSKLIAIFPSSITILHSKSEFLLHLDNFSVLTENVLYNFKQKQIVLCTEPMNFKILSQNFNLGTFYAINSGTI